MIVNSRNKFPYLSELFDKKENKLYVQETYTTWQLETRSYPSIQLSDSVRNIKGISCGKQNKQNMNF